MTIVYKAILYNKYNIISYPYIISHFLRFPAISETADGKFGCYPAVEFKLGVGARSFADIPCTAVLQH